MPGLRQGRQDRNRGSLESSPAGNEPGELGESDRGWIAKKIIILIINE